MISFHFKINSMPIASKRYSLLVETEGEIAIKKMDQVLFTYKEILLVEFARALGEWVKINHEKFRDDFIYNSMDIEEEPVLAFRLQDSGKFLIESSVSDIRYKSLINATELFFASKKFLKDLHAQLINKGVKFEDFDAFEML